ncbi:Asp-tRNA(Asn)/Glu-tRNA(Gln) amidotransferase subunit GatA [Blastococcus sp. Marseille-P5729]|uniref:Asp-tRNA(Asn)/Glu-tRNA(Gln) amidotransferase subunit GatA n=1 Tax=Blastococcus sp. Marseille-P5729 TaxID=2086582 RepID=UPI000D0FA69B|nr:Asp-tRNA(Asn)/Glu-tRNA(Gln) amidotransferase subunit GatA [Blastococcus sp. Marseille-P5729]
MSDLTRLGAAELAAAIADGSTSSVQATRAHLDRIEQIDERTGAFLHVGSERALAAAERADAAIKAGAAGPLTGVPVAVKDAFVTRGVPTTAGSRILEGWLPPYESTVTGRLADAGMVVLGKANMDEFAMGSTNENSAYRPAANPWNLELTPGGSSGGSAVAVSAYEAPLAVGTDTGGSIRQPAALTGIVGMKPTYGTSSRYGLIAFSSSLDTPGPFGRSVLDTALLHEAMSGYDPRDSTSIDAPVARVVEAARRGATEGLAGLRVGVVTELLGAGLEAGVRAEFDAAVQTLRDLGADIVEISCPHFSYGVAAYYLIAPSEASSNLARFDSVRYGLRVGDDGRRGLEEVVSMTREAGFGPEVKRRIILGTYALSAGYYDAFYGQAQKVRTLIARDFTSAFEDVDVLVSPTAPTVAYPRGKANTDPLAVYLLDLTTLPASLAGTPAMSVPIGLSDDPRAPGGQRLPVGMQIMAPSQGDERCYRVGAALEKALVDARGGLFLDGAPVL